MSFHKEWGSSAGAGFTDSTLSQQFYNTTVQETPVSTSLRSNDPTVRKVLDSSFEPISRMGQDILNMTAQKVEWMINDKYNHDRRAIADLIRRIEVLELAPKMSVADAATEELRIRISTFRLE